MYRALLQQGQKHNIFLFISMLLLFIALVLAWHGQSNIQSFQDYHQQLAKKSVTSAAHEITLLIYSLRHSVDLFVKQEEGLLEAIYKKPYNNQEIIQELTDKIKRYFPNHVAFTLADIHGEPLLACLDHNTGQTCAADVEDLLHFGVSNQCQTDIKSFAQQTGSHQIYIHQSPNKKEDYHFDIMTLFKQGNEIKGVFFISFNLSALISILEYNQTLGHHLLLVKPETKDKILLELSAEGMPLLQQQAKNSQSFWQGFDWQKAAVLARYPVENTLWHMVDVVEPALFKQQTYRIILNKLFIFSGFAFFSGLFFWLLKRETCRRNQVEKQLQRSLSDLKHEREAEKALMLAKEEAERQRYEAEKNNQYKSLFLANMSHELRTPLSAILGYSELLVEDAKKLDLPDFSADLAKIYVAGQRLLQLVDDTLDLAKIEAGKMSFHLETVRIASMVQNIRFSFKPKCQKNNNEFKIEDDSGVEFIQSDVMKLRQILLNLLNNANKFTHDGTIILQMRPCTKDGIHWLCFSVQDNGIGIKSEDLPQLFQPFKKWDDSFNRNYGGTGLGLVITKKLTEGLNGRLEADSVYGKGSVFSVYLPLVTSGEKIKH